MTQPESHRLDFDALRERFYPLCLGVAATIAWLLFGHELVKVCIKEEWHIDQMYTAVFAFLAITTGFLATFYCTIVCMSEGFVRAIRDTKKMQGFLAFLKGAIILGFFVSLGSIPMMVGEPAPTERFSIAAVLVSIWIGCAVWAIAAFYRVASLFFFLFETKIHPRRRGG